MKKYIAFALMFILVLTCFAACDDSGGNVSDPGTSSPQASTGDESQGGVEGEYTPADKTFNNETITILGKLDDLHTFSRRQWEYDPELKGDAVNEAVQQRNDWLKSTYGINIVYLQNPVADRTAGYFITDTVRNEVMNPMGTFDIICDGLTTLGTLASENYLYDLKTLNPEYLDLNKSWWDQRAIESLAIYDKVYYAAGDILITDDEYTHCILFNKNMMEQNNILSQNQVSSMYDLVTDYKWTYDKMFEIAKACSQSLTGEAIKTKDDIFGLVADIGCLYYMMAGSGLNMAPMNSEKEPVLDVHNSKSADVFSKLLDYMNDKDTVIFTERFFPAATAYGDAEKQFAEGRSAFMMTKLGGLYTLIHNADSELKTGVLPVPMYNSEQEAYYNAVAPLHFSCVAVPISTSKNKLDAVCIALEGLGYMGQSTLSPAYIERNLKIKYTDDNPDADMVDLVLTNRTFDLALVYNWGGLTSFFNQFAGSDLGDVFKSKWDAIESQAQTELEATLQSFKK